MLTFFKRIGLCGLALALGWGATEAQELNLQVLIDEALAKSPTAADSAASGRAAFGKLSTSIADGLPRPWANSPRESG